jgi:hypothetical protein
MFAKTDYPDGFRAVYDLLVNNDTLDYRRFEEKHPNLAARMRVVMECQLAQDPPFMTKVFDGWRQMSLGKPQRWRQSRRVA